jgi:hypothetical protein
MMSERGHRFTQICTDVTESTLCTSGDLYPRKLSSDIRQSPDRKSVAGMLTLPRVSRDGSAYDTGTISTLWQAIAEDKPAGGLLPHF